MPHPWPAERQSPRVSARPAARSGSRHHHQRRGFSPTVSSFTSLSLPRGRAQAASPLATNRNISVPCRQNLRKGPRQWSLPASSAHGRHIRQEDNDEGIDLGSFDGRCAHRRDVRRQPRPAAGQRAGPGRSAGSTKAAETAPTAPVRARERSRVRMAGSGTTRATRIKSRPDSGQANGRLSAPAAAPGRTPGPGIPRGIDCFESVATERVCNRGPAASQVPLPPAAGLIPSTFTRRLLGHWRQGRASSESGHVRDAAMRPLQFHALFYWLVVDVDDPALRRGARHAQSQLHTDIMTVIARVDRNRRQAPDDTSGITPPLPARAGSRSSAATF